MGGRTSSASRNKYNAKAYDRINLAIPKGDKDTIQAHAQAQGESVNGFIKRAIQEAIQRDLAADDSTGDAGTKEQAGTL